MLCPKCKHPVWPMAHKPPNETQLKNKNDYACEECDIVYIAKSKKCLNLNNILGKRPLTDADRIVITQQKIEEGIPV